jgi:hypothetical protein
MTVHKLHRYHISQSQLIITFQTAKVSTLYTYIFMRTHLSTAYITYKPLRPPHIKHRHVKVAVHNVRLFCSKSRGYWAISNGSAPAFKFYSPLIAVYGDTVSLRSAASLPLSASVKFSLSRLVAWKQPPPCTDSTLVTDILKDLKKKRLGPAGTTSRSTQNLSIVVNLS